MKRKKLEGFTLLEMLVVLAIIGILMSIGMASYTKIQQSATNKAVLVEMKQFQIALLNYKIDHGTPPTSVKALLNGGYITRDLALDPWNEEYILQVNPNSGQVTLISKGADKKLGTADDISFKNNE